MTIFTARRAALGIAVPAIVAVTFAAVGPAQAATPAGDSAATASTLSAQDHRSVPRIVREWAAAWNSTDSTQLAKLFTADGVYIDYAIGRTMTGRDQVTAWKAGTDQLIAGVDITVLDAFRSGDHVAIESIYSGHVNGAPRGFAVHGTTILDLHNGKIAVNKDNYSLATLLAQSGLPADWTPPRS
jgi:uncharacterized protein (TIGR02246 family)